MLTRSRSLGVPTSSSRSDVVPADSPLTTTSGGVIELILATLSSEVTASKALSKEGLLVLLPSSTLTV